MKPIKYLVLMIAGVAQLFGCSGAKLLDLTIPHSGYVLHKDIAYGENPRHKLDIYVPEKPDPAGGVLVFFYGGSWQKGSKDIYRFVGQKFASHGYVTVIADYRLYPEIYYPDFMDDAAKVVSWTHAHIGEYGGNKDNLFVSGHSAGGYMAVMLALNQRFMKEAGGDPNWIKGAIGVAGPYDFLPFTDPKIIAIFSKVEDKQTQPITFARAGAPPIMLISGDSDEEVGQVNADHLAARLEELHSPVVKRVYPGVAHIGIVLALADGFEGKAPTAQDMLWFLRAHSVPK